MMQEKNSTIRFNGEARVPGVLFRPPSPRKDVASLIPVSRRDFYPVWRILPIP
jgi:hypothetical protein